MSDWDELYTYLENTPWPYPEEFQAVLEKILGPDSVVPDVRDKFLRLSEEEQRRGKDTAYQAWLQAKRKMRKHRVRDEDEERPGRG